MILAEFKQNQTQQIKSVKITGHAESADPGQDIVCAAVSSLVISTLNYLISLEILDEEQVTANETAGGYISAQFSKHLVPESVIKQETMLEYLYFGLGQIAEQYPDYITVIVK